MSIIPDDLARYGPDADFAPVTPADAREYCRWLARSHYENFPLVSWLLPRELHQHFFNVYAYCRWADDLADETGDPALSLRLLQWWRGELDRCFAGETRHPVFVALSQTIREFALPQEPFANLLSAFEQDQHLRDYQTFDQLRDYCRQSADPVGRIVLGLLRAATPENVARSDSICTGLQLANFWQDVARDADRGRTYLPREDRERFGYTDADLAQRRTNPAFLSLMKFEVDRAREFLQQGLPLADAVPRRFRVDVDLFTRGGLKILDRIEAINYRVWETRPTVTKWDAFKLLAGSLWRGWWRRRCRSGEPSRTGS